MFIFLLHSRQKRWIYIEYDDVAQIIIIIIIVGFCWLCYQDHCGWFGN